MSDKTKDDGNVLKFWPELEPIADTLQPVEKFDPGILPETISPWVEDIAKRMECAPDYPAVVAMVVLSSLIGRKVGIRPKQKDDWLVIPNLWGCLVGRVSAMKSPPLIEVLKPIKDFEKEAKNAHEKAMEQHSAEIKYRKLKEKQNEREAEKLIKEGNSKDVVLAKLRRLDDEQPPTWKRYITSDPTVEKLGELLKENPNGILLVRDELNGFLRSLDREDRTSDRAFYLEAFSGTGSYTFDRIGRGTVHVDSTVISIVGTIQPSKLIPYIKQSVSQSNDDGLVQRFQLTVYPDQVEFKNIDEYPNTNAREGAYETFRILNELPAQTDQDGILGLRFSTEAQKLFNDWREGLEALIRSDDIQQSLSDHFTKYRSLIPSLALIIQLAHRTDSREVGVKALKNALAWDKYLRSHAERIFSASLNNDYANARTILTKIRKGDITAPIKTWKITKKGWGGLTDKESVEAALSVLINHGYLREETAQNPAGGRPSTVYHVSPRFKGARP